MAKNLFIDVLFKIVFLLVTKIIFEMYKNYGFPHSYNKMKKHLNQNISISIQFHHT